MSADHAPVPGLTQPLQPRHRRDNPLQLLAAAPHRLLFFVGASNVLLAMAWWSWQLVGMRWPQFRSALDTTVPAGWIHATLMQYQVLPAFIFGFLITVIPRWTNQPALGRRHYIPVGLGLLGGQLLTLIGVSGVPELLVPGIALTTLGWSVATWYLVALLWRERGRTWHAISCVAALILGLLGLCAFGWLLLSPDALLLFASIKIGTFGLLLPIYFTVCHRMLTFFASRVVAGYRVTTPMITLAAFWALTLAHLALELLHLHQFLWAVDLGLLTLTAGLLALWWPRAPMPPLLRVLFLGYAWLPVSMALYVFQSAWYALSGEFLLGRGPAHAIYIGFFGSMLVAMVTRVTQGHSGRPLVLGRVAAFAFVTVQLVAISRVVAELVADGLLWQVIAAVGWLAAFLPWVLRSSTIYLTPRADGAPG